MFFHLACLSWRSKSHAEPHVPILWWGGWASAESDGYQDVSEWNDGTHLCIPKTTHRSLASVTKKFTSVPRKKQEKAPRRGQKIELDIVVVVGSATLASVALKSNLDPRDTVLAAVWLRISSHCRGHAECSFGCYEKEPKSTILNRDML